MRLICLLLPLVMTLTGCTGGTNPCDDYCSYVCDCHTDEAGYDCDACFTQYDGADAELQDECETALIDLKAQDDADGHVCTDGGGTATDTGI